MKKITYKSGNSTFFCALDCSYKINPALALGKKSICWRCGNEFTINEYSLRLVKPHCEACHKSKNGKEYVVTEVNHEDKTISLSKRLQNEIKQAQEKEEEL